ncbi:hypothetical protein PR048_020951 [Dryococelus australis]|uniref:HTH psq-type domain-containing protein n=1 Tax=Dryococelus australis TaxID=614101 RepID=A0ABQ9GWV4_9NEOP|nr:hypothetical protein PR048_020951 [Dryococelus australis]
MVGKYKCKTDYQSWDEIQMQHAIDAVNNKTMGWLKAAKNFDIPHATLRRRTTDKNTQVLGTQKGLGQDEMAGWDCLTDFRNRHPDIELRDPEATLAAALIFVWKNWKEEQYDGALTGTLGIAQESAYGKAATNHNALSEFSNTGIWQMNPYIFPDFLFSHAATTDESESTNGAKDVSEMSSENPQNPASQIPTDTDHEISATDPVSQIPTDTDHEIPATDPVSQIPTDTDHEISATDPVSQIPTDTDHEISTTDPASQTPGEEHLAIP